MQPLSRESKLEQVAPPTTLLGFAGFALDPAGRTLTDAGGKIVPLRQAMQRLPRNELLSHLPLERSAV